LLVVIGLAVATTGCSSQPEALSAAAASALPADGRYKAERKFIYPAEFQPDGPYTPRVLAGNDAVHLRPDR
jgi:hypothetical protein